MHYNILLYWKCVLCSEWDLISWGISFYLNVRPPKQIPFKFTVMKDLAGSGGFHRYEWVGQDKDTGLVY